MRQVDYNVQQYRNYSRGRALVASQLGAWIDAFAAQLPDRRPLRGLDLGCGTGRFTPALAEAFGPVIGVEPAPTMRGIAEAQAAHPEVEFRAGSAESIPLPDGSIDYVLMFLVWHHVADKAAAARELARVAAPGATETVGLTVTYEPIVSTRSELLEKLRLRPYSTFEQLTEEEIEIGFERLDRAIAADPDSTPPPSTSTLLTLKYVPAP